MTVMTVDVGYTAPCAAVLFDLDGVLVDSAACVEGTWRRWAIQHALDPAHVIAVAHGRRTIETVQLVAPQLAADQEAAALAAHESRTTDGVFEIPGARELLRSLPPRAWAIVTSGNRAVATLRLRHTGLPVPEVLVSADDIRRGKAHAEPTRPMRSRWLTRRSPVSRRCTSVAHRRVSCSRSVCHPPNAKLSNALAPYWGASPPETSRLGAYRCRSH